LSIETRKRLVVGRSGEIERGGAALCPLLRGGGYLSCPILASSPSLQLEDSKSCCLLFYCRLIRGDGEGSCGKSWLRLHVYRYVFEAATRGIGSDAAAIYAAINLMLLTKRKVAFSTLNWRKMLLISIMESVPSLFILLPMRKSYFQLCIPSELTSNRYPNPNRYLCMSFIVTRAPGVVLLSSRSLLS
jgi:hypothetical protein